MSVVLLALDTCTARASIALRDQTTLRAEMTWEAQRHETAAIAARIRDLMRACRIAPEDIGCVAVAIGPGSFTGVRCGLAIGKGMAVARNLPMIGVTAFDVIAHAQPPQPAPMLALLEVGRSRVAACPYEWHEGAPSVAGEWQIHSWAELAERVEPPLYVCGDLPPAWIAALRAKVTLAPAALNLRRAGFLAELGMARWERGEVDDAMTLTAVYPAET
ncbi:MAG: tRNA (adenosine(37)-N6)-threonylcarbamoyltransferase complex dimerization subunit type 1 TsaB [Candidatus Roseilinea sp.]|nr:MAG: tRNA (adenosine(37)-N6)-threonylcarbamoyltransferase complex dimerization subunit type 1 TsaB [Candidatus Roseilinea sp.]